MIEVSIVGGYTKRFHSWEVALEYMEHCSSIMKKVRFRVMYDGTKQLDTDDARS